MLKPEAAKQSVAAGLSMATGRDGMTGPSVMREQQHGVGTIHCGGTEYGSRDKCSGGI
jgi:hypothetical protein